MPISENNDCPPDTRIGQEEGRAGSHGRGFTAEGDCKAVGSVPEAAPPQFNGACPPRGIIRFLSSWASGRGLHKKRAAGEDGEQRGTPKAPVWGAGAGRMRGDRSR